MATSLTRISAVISIVLILSFVAQPIEIALPIEQELFYKLSIAIDMLKEALVNFNTIYQNRFMISRRTQRVKMYLSEVKRQIADNNVALGWQNQVNGDANLILGNFNKIQGDNNWVFVSQYAGAIDGDLLIQNWRIELDKSSTIVYNPRIAISYIDEAKNLLKKQNYLSDDRRAVIWSDWALPNTNNYNVWKGYTGYADYANQWSQRTGTPIAYDSLGNNLQTNSQTASQTAPSFLNNIGSSLQKPISYFENLFQSFRSRFKK